MEPLYNGPIGSKIVPKYGGFRIMEVKQYTKVLVWDQNMCPEYRGFLYNYGGPDL